MYTPKFNPSLKVDSFFGNNFFSENEKFTLFLKAYYEWMQTTKITFINKSGNFIRNETIVGRTSKSTGIIKQIADGELIISLKSDLPFERYETIEGKTSNATATIKIVKDNVIRESGQLLDNRTIEYSIDKYTDYLREELYESIPKNYYGNKRLLALKFKDFFESKSNEQSYRFLFKLLYDENIEFYYPGEDVLRISNGKFEQTQIIRTVVTSRIFEFLEKTIRGVDSGVFANVIDIKKFFIGSEEVAEMTLKLLSGKFRANEMIVDVSDESLRTTVYGIISGFVINDGGSGYNVSDKIIISGDGSEAEAIVSSVQQSPVSSLKVNSIGHGYRLGTQAYIDNSGTGGSGLIIQVTELANTYTATIDTNTYTLGEISKVSIINRGSNYYKKPTITLEDAIISSAGLLTDKLITIANPGTNYGVGNTLIFTGGSGTSAAGIVASVIESLTFDLLFEDGFQMKADGSYYDIIKNEDWSVKGPIKRLELTNFGTGYTSTSLPLISISTTTGSDASLIVTGIQGTSANVSVDAANNIAGIGSIRALQIKNFGIKYTTATASVSTIGDGNAVLTPIISGLGIKTGEWTNDDGKVSFKKIQDSYYYQDFSYVIRSGLRFAEYSAAIRRIIHPAGLQPFGEIQIFNHIDVEAFFKSNITKAIAKIVYNLVVGIINSGQNSRHTVIISPPVSDLISNLANTNYSILTGTSYINSSIFTPNISTLSYQYQSDSDVRSNFIPQSTNLFLSGSLIDLSNRADSEITKYSLTPGTVSSTSVNYSGYQISQFASTSIFNLSQAKIGTLQSAIIGVGTSFTTEFIPGSTITANNEFFVITSIANNNLMTVNQFPSSPFTNIRIYKWPT